MLRIYYPKELSQNIQINEQRHYIVNVHRLQKNDRMHLFNEHGEFEYLIEHIERDYVYCTKVAHIDNAEPQSLVSIALPLIKIARLEWAIEKVVEIGVKKIYLIYTDRTIERNPDIARLNRIACAAIQQSGRLRMPEIVGPITLVDLCMNEKDLIVCNPEGQKDAYKLSQGLKEYTIVVGPEGGFTEKEGKLLFPYKQLCLVDDGILRAETAAIVGLGIMKHFAK